MPEDDEQIALLISLLAISTCLSKLIAHFLKNGRTENFRINFLFFFFRDLYVHLTLSKTLKFPLHKFSKFFEAYESFFKYGGTGFSQKYFLFFSCSTKERFGEYNEYLLFNYGGFKIKWCNPCVFLFRQTLIEIFLNNG